MLTIMYDYHTTVKTKSLTTFNFFSKQAEEGQYASEAANRSVWRKEQETWLHGDRHPVLNRFTLQAEQTD